MYTALIQGSLLRSVICRTMIVSQVNDQKEGAPDYKIRCIFYTGLPPWLSVRIEKQERRLSVKLFMHISMAAGLLSAF